MYWVVKPGWGVGLLTTKLQPFLAASLLRMSFPEALILGGPSYLPLTFHRMSRNCAGEGAAGSHISISLLQVCWTCSMNTLSLISQCRFVVTLRQLLRKRLSEVQWQLYFWKCLQNLSEPHTSSYLLPSSCISSPLAAHCCSAQLNLHLTLHPTVYLKLYRLGMIKLVPSQPQLLIYFSKWACSCTPLWSTEQVIFQNRRGKNALALRHHSLAQSVSSPVLSAAVAWFIPAPPVLDQPFPAFPAPDPAAALRLWRVHGLQLLELLLHAALHCRHLPLPETTSGESPGCLDQTGLEPGALGDRAVVGPSRGWDAGCAVPAAPGSWARHSPRGTWIVQTQ